MILVRVLVVAGVGHGGCSVCILSACMFEVFSWLSRGCIGEAYGVEHLMH